MSTDSITFACPACGSRLTVPGQLAGVVGPCPTCRTQIQAPFPPPPQAVYQGYPDPGSHAYQGPSPSPVYPPAPAPVSQTPVYHPAPPVQPTAYQSPAGGYQQPALGNGYPASPPPGYHDAAANAYQVSPVTGHQAYPGYQMPAPPPPPSYRPPPAQTGPPVHPTTPAPSSYYSPETASSPLSPAHSSQQAAPPQPPGFQPLSQTAVSPLRQPLPPDYQPPPSPLASSQPAVLKPEPRQLPNRTQSEPVAKQMPTNERGPVIAKSSSQPPRRGHGHGRNRLVRLIGPLLFLLAAGLVIYGVMKFLKNRNEEASGPPPSSYPERKIEPASTIPSRQAPAEEPIPTLPVPTPDLPVISPPPELPEGMEPSNPGKASMEVLEKFLAATSLAERLPLLETRTPAAELATSCLASPLPQASYVNEARETNAEEQVTDHYYSVDFTGGKQEIAAQTILVRIRGTSEPKVVVDPFLDSYGGRLAAFASQPSDKTGIFQVIVSAVASCNDENVPNREKKLTLKLLPRDNTKEITRAYFGRQSKIGLMLEDGTYSLSYGRAKACTVVLRWNTEDRPETPYLEATDLKTLDWNP